MLGASLSPSASAQDLLAWKEWRRGGIGSSDAAAIAGMDPYRGPMSVWLEKTHRLADDVTEESEWMRWGRLLETAIVEEFQVRTGLFVRSRQQMVSNPDRPWMRATLDGAVTDLPPGLDSNRDVALGILEIKTVVGFKSEAWADGNIPDHFSIQVAHQLAVSGLQHVWLAVLFGGQRLEIREVDRDDSLIASLIELEEAFWTKHVLGDVAPGGDGHEGTTEDLRRAFADAGGEAVELTPEFEAVLQLRSDAKHTLKALEKECAAADQALMAALGDAEVGLLGGRPRVTWKRHERSTIDLEALRDRHPDLAKQLTVTSGYRVLRLVGAKGEA